MQAIKQGLSRRALKSVRKRGVAAQQELFAVGSERVWQRRFYDFNVGRRASGSRNCATSTAIRWREGWCRNRSSGRGAAMGAKLSGKRARCKSIGGGRQDEDPDAGCMSRHLCQNEAVTKLVPSAKRTRFVPLSLSRHGRIGLHMPPLRGWTRVCSTVTVSHRVS